MKPSRGLLASVGLKVTAAQKAELETLMTEMGFDRMTDLLRVIIDDYLEQRRNGSRRAVNRRPVVDIELTCTLFRKYLEEQITEVNEPKEGHAADLLKKV